MLLHNDIIWIQHVLRKAIREEALSDEEKQRVAPLVNQLHYATYDGWITSEIEEWLDRHDLSLPDQTTMDTWVRKVQEIYRGEEIENCISQTKVEIMGKEIEKINANETPDVKDKESSVSSEQLELF